MSAVLSNRAAAAEILRLTDLGRSVALLQLVPEAGPRPDARSESDGRSEPGGGRLLVPAPGPAGTSGTAGGEEVREDGSGSIGSLGDPALDAAGIAAAREAMAVGDRRPEVQLLRTTGGESHRVFIEVHHPADAMVVVGAGHIAQPLARMGSLLGLRVTVLDDRPEWARKDRFPGSSRVLRVDFGDPFRDIAIHTRSHVVLVTRGHRYDYECLVRLLRLDPQPAYIGMIGSRRRVRATFAQLGAEGFGPEAASRIWAPIGLDIGAQAPTEIAIAVAAEIVLARRGGTGKPLRELERVATRFMDSDADRVRSRESEET